MQVELLSIWQRTGATVVFITHGIEEAIYLGQRVAVMTSRPGRIKTIIPIDLGDRDAVDDIRSTPKFTAYRHQLWELLRNEITRTAALEQAPHIETSKEVVSVG